MLKDPTNTKWTEQSLLPPIQFVPFRDYIDRSGNQVLSMARLAKDVLAEIPDQLLSFMKSRGIEPRPPLAVTSDSPSVSTTTATNTSTTKHCNPHPWEKDSRQSGASCLGKGKCVCACVCRCVLGFSRLSDRNQISKLNLRIPSESTDYEDSSARQEA